MYRVLSSVSLTPIIHSTHITKRDLTCHEEKLKVSIFFIWVFDCVTLLDVFLPGDSPLVLAVPVCIPFEPLLDFASILPNVLPTFDLEQWSPTFESRSLSQSKGKPRSTAQIIILH